MPTTGNVVEITVAEVGESSVPMGLLVSQDKHRNKEESQTVESGWLG